MRAPVFLYICQPRPFLKNTKEVMLLLPLILGWNQRRGKLNDLPPNPLLNPSGGCNRYSWSALGLPKDRLLETSVTNFRNFSALVLLTVEGAKHIQSWLVRAYSIVQGGEKVQAMAQVVKNLPTVQETGVPSLGHEDSMEKGLATHLSGESHG